MNELRAKDNATIDGGIREAMARVDMNEKVAAEVPMPKAQQHFTAQATALQMSSATEQLSKSAYEETLKLIAEKEKLVASMTEKAVMLMSELHAQSNELGELRTHALKLGITQRAHGLAVYKPTNGRQ